MTPPNLRRWHYRTLIANLVAQAGIVLTGATVRLTASGLGCPTWPECVAGSIAPTSEQTEAFHKYIEFGNRLLTFVILFVALASLIAVRQLNQDRVKAGLERRRSLTVLALGIILGIFVQAILGGITVLTGLHPLTVAAHFMVSIGLITLATILLVKAQESNDRPISLQVAKPIAFGMKLHIWIVLLVIALGTLVTGSGPHAGDTNDIVRLGFEFREITTAHAALVWLFVGLTGGLLVALISTSAPKPVIKQAWIVMGICIAQGTVGYVQFFTGLPWGLVAIHVLGACLLWIYSLKFYLSRNVRG
jgi:cytochrome c oxidase assembly protein subunit 15